MTTRSLLGSNGHVVDLSGQRSDQSLPAWPEGLVTWEDTEYLLFNSTEGRGIAPLLG